MTGSTDWLSALGVLLSGLVLGFMFIYAQTRKKSGERSVVARSPELLELEAKRDVLVRQLRELDDIGGDPAERERLEQQAAGVLRALDELQSHPGSLPATPATAVPEGPARPAEAARPAGLFTRNPALKGFLWGVGSVAAIGLLGLFVYRSSSEKTAVVPSAMNAAPAEGTTPTAPGNDSALLQLQQAVQSEPDNVERRIELARAYLERENMMGVFEQTRAVLDKHPDEPRALTYNAIVRMAMGRGDEAAAMLERATRKDPGLVDAWVATAWMQIQRGDRGKAHEAIETAIHNSPSSEAQLRDVWVRMSTQQPGQPGAGFSGGPANGSEPAAGSLPPGHPQLDGGAPAAPQSSSLAPASSIHVTLNLDGDAKSKSGVLFVIARAAGQTAGMPIAVKRLTASSFPLDVDISTADSMMGKPLPPMVSIEARLDSDGDAMTRTPGDPRAFADGVASGAKISMLLKVSRQ
jgi:cytochrome c-type biogenesis protein CcmH